MWGRISRKPWKNKEGQHFLNWVMGKRCNFNKLTMWLSKKKWIFGDHPETCIRGWHSLFLVEIYKYFLCIYLLTFWSWHGQFITARSPISCKTLKMRFCFFRGYLEGCHNSKSGLLKDAYWYCNRKWVSNHKNKEWASSRQEYYPWGMTPQRSIADTLVMGRQDEGS